MAHAFSTLNTIYNNASAFTLSNDGDRSASNSSTSSFFDDGHTPVVYPADVQARINEFRLEQSQIPGVHAALPITEQHVVKLEALFNEVDIDNGVQGARSVSDDESVSSMDTPSLLSTDSNVFGDSDDECMSIIAPEDLPKDVRRVFEETETPGVFNLEYYHRHESSKPIVSHNGNPPPPPQGNTIPIRCRVSIEDISDDESLLSEQTRDLPPQTTVAESVNEHSYRVIMYTLKWLASNPLHVANRFDSMPNDLLEDLCIVLSRFLPNDFTQACYEPVAEILKMGRHVYGLD
ncbi:hypothetical protein AURDEDRAFT_175060 [Auricularia subglabra TFB-10046 SS5]|nr:hypothetical protein AURDEDRAFT_175060 [Auricularia subglabra TFB-10046 SS5]